MDSSASKDIIRASSWKGRNVRPTSLLSSRAKLLRERFASARRSLSDSCKDSSPPSSPFTLEDDGGQRRGTNATEWSTLTSTPTLPEEEATTFSLVDIPGAYDDDALSWQQEEAASTDTEARGNDGMVSRAVEEEPDYIPTISEYLEAKRDPSAQHHAALARSESVSAPGGCLSGLYGSLDRRARLRLVHQHMSMDETRSPRASTSSGSSVPGSDISASSSSSSWAKLPKSTVDRRRKCLQRKQTNSAPDSLEETSRFTDRLAVTYYVDSVFSREATANEQGQSSRHSWHTDEQTRMFLSPSPEPGLVRSRDGGRVAPYLNLPSPNVQTEEHDSDVFRKLSSFDEDEVDKDDDFQEGPPASALTRRTALVPPKLLPDGYESATEDAETYHSTPTGSVDGNLHRPRRNSIVVIPPMQICPGDLLVYSKVLTQRNNLLGSQVSDLDGSTTSLAVADDTSRKGKNTWSLLRLFDRSNRTKSESLCGLEEVLNTLTTSEFNDEQLSRYKGMPWSDFVASFEDRNSSSDSSSSSPSTPLMVEPSVLGSNLSNSSRSDQFALSKNEQKKKEAMWDLFQSECMFLYDHLMVLKNVFMEPLKKIQVEGYMMFAEPEVLFGNLDELCCVTYAFCKEFINLLLQYMTSGDLQTSEVLVKLFQKVLSAETGSLLKGQSGSTKPTSLSQAYHRYSLNYINALNYLETLRRQVEFNEFEKWCQRDIRCKKLQLTDLLVAPVQHIMKIPLILKDIETRTDDLQEKEVITQILETEESSLRELDDKMKWLKNFERLLEIQRNIVWPSVIDLDPKAFIPDFLKGPLSKQPCERLIVSPRRQIIQEGPLLLLDSGKPSEMYVVLFDDMLLITRRKKGLHKKKSSITENWSSSCSRGSSFTSDSNMKYVVYRQPMSLDRFFLHDVSPQDAVANKLENAFVLVSLNRFQQIISVYTFQAASDQIKQIWLIKLKDTQDKWKRTLQNTVFRSQRIGNVSGVK